MIKKNIKTILKGCVLYFIIATIGIIISKFLMLDKFEEYKGTFDDILTFGKQREFKGTLIKKFINRDEHMDKTLVIELRKNGASILQNEVFPFDHSGFYEYVKIGDSLVKEEGSLFATIYRTGKKDTIIYFKFKNYETGDIFPKDQTSIKNSNR